MSYNELEQGYLGLTSQPLFYIGDDCSGYINWNKIEKARWCYVKPKIAAQPRAT